LSEAQDDGGIMVELRKNFLSIVLYFKENVLDVDSHGKKRKTALNEETRKDTTNVTAGAADAPTQSK
jgi:uncharacterized protein YukJ